MCVGRRWQQAPPSALCAQIAVIEMKLLCHSDLILFRVIFFVFIFNLFYLILWHPMEANGTDAEEGERAILRFIPFRLNNGFLHLFHCCEVSLLASLRTISDPHTHHTSQTQGRFSGQYTNFFFYASRVFRIEA